MIVGFAEDEETTTMTQLAGQRAVNVKYYFTQGEGGQLDRSFPPPGEDWVRKEQESQNL